jgi:hypothetical protein
MVEKQQLPVRGRSHWCDGHTSDRRNCKQIVLNTSDHCEAGHPNFIRTLLTSKVTPQDVSAAFSAWETEDLSSQTMLEHARAYSWRGRVKWLRGLKPGDYASWTGVGGSYAAEILAISDDEIVTRSLGGLIHWPRDGISDGPLSQGQHALHLSQPDEKQVGHYLRQRFLADAEEITKSMDVEQLKLLAKSMSDIAKGGSPTLIRKGEAEEILARIAQVKPTICDAEWDFDEECVFCHFCTPYGQPPEHTPDCPWVQANRIVSAPSQ